MAGRGGGVGNQKNESWKAAEQQSRREEEK